MSIENITNQYAQTLNVIEMLRAEIELFKDVEMTTKRLKRNPQRYSHELNLIHQMSPDVIEESDDVRNLVLTYFETLDKRLKTIDNQELVEQLKAERILFSSQY